MACDTLGGTASLSTDGIQGLAALVRKARSQRPSRKAATCCTTYAVTLRLDASQGAGTGEFSACLASVSYQKV
jgi:hypothetical protein